MIGSEVGEWAVRCVGKITIPALRLCITGRSAPATRAKMAMAPSTDNSLRFIVTSQAIFLRVWVARGRKRVSRFTSKGIFQLVCSARRHGRSPGYFDDQDHPCPSNGSLCSEEPDFSAPYRAPIPGRRLADRIASRAIRIRAKILTDAGRGCSGSGL